MGIGGGGLFHNWGIFHNRLFCIQIENFSTMEGTTSQEFVVTPANNIVLHLNYNISFVYTQYLLWYIRINPHDDPMFPTLVLQTHRLREFLSFEEGDC